MSQEEKMIGTKINVLRQCEVFHSSSLIVIILTFNALGRQSVTQGPTSSKLETNTLGFNPESDSFSQKPPLALKNSLVVCRVGGVM